MYQTGQYQPFFDSLMVVYNSGDMAAYQAQVTKAIPRIEKATGSPITMDISPEKLKAYTTVGGVPFLDNNYTVFGKVFKGLDVVDKIAAVQTDQGERPLEDIRMTITRSKMSRSEIEKECNCKLPSK